MPKIMPKAKLVDHIFLAQFKPPPPIPLFPLPPLISTTNKVTFARNWRHTEVQNTTFVYNIFKFSRDTGILDLWDKNILTRKKTFCPTPHGVILNTDCEARGKFDLNCKYTADIKYSSYLCQDLYTWSSELR